MIIAPYHNGNLYEYRATIKIYSNLNIELEFQALPLVFIKIKQFVLEYALNPFF